MIFDPILDLFRGKAVTIPPMDGAFRPNTALDEAAALAALPTPDNLALLGPDLLVSSGNHLYRLAPGSLPVLWQSFDAPITALAVSATGELAVGLETGVLLVDDQPQHLVEEVKAITALAFAPDGALWLANGSAEHAPSDWAADLMRHGATGSLWCRHAGGEAFHRMVAGLAWPYAVLPRPGGRIAYTESWRHRVMERDAEGAITALIELIPGYPARLAPTAEGGALMSVFAPRNRLIEFVLQEKHYREEMIAQIPREHWIAPALSSGRSFLEPLQCGGIRTMGVHKPWSPSRSWGMVVRLDRQMNPIASWHSRANGHRHGVCSALEHAGQVIVAAKGGDVILTLPVEG